MKKIRTPMALVVCLILCLSMALILPSVRTAKADANWGFSMSNLDKT